MDSFENGGPEMEGAGAGGPCAPAMKLTYLNER